MIHVERYIKALKTFEEVRAINVGDRGAYEVQLYENKVYVLGGCNQHRRLKSVSIPPKHSITRRRTLRVLNRLNILPMS